MLVTTAAVVKQSRNDKKADCNPVLSLDLHDQIKQLAEITNKTKTSFAGNLAHYCLWNKAVLEPLHPYFQFAVALSWDVNVQSNVFHVWMPDREGWRDIRSVVREEQEQEGKRFKFRISQEDRRRLQVLAYALNMATLDSLWPILFPLALLDGRSLWNLTNSRDVTIRGFHPLQQEWLTAKSWDNHREVEVQAHG